MIRRCSPKRRSAGWKSIRHAGTRWSPWPGMSWPPRRKLLDACVSYWAIKSFAEERVRRTVTTRINNPRQRSGARWRDTMLSTICAFLMVFLWSFDVQAQTPFYQGKTVTIIVGTKAGDVYDLYPRLLAEFLPKYIPGNPN